VKDGLVYIPEETGYLHCLDANTGHRHWTHDLKAGTWGSAICADGRVFLGSDDGVMHVFAQGRAENLLIRIDMEESISTTPTVANGVIYVATRSKLYAIAGR
jgi:outer membrane protein assembly factor BamB